MNQGPLNWLRLGARRLDDKGFVRAFTVDGITLSPPGAAAPADALDAQAIDASGLSDLMAQLEDEGATVPTADHTLLPWEQAFRLLATSDYAAMAEALALPPEADWVPELQSHGSLADRSFAIVVSDWFDAGGRRHPRGQRARGYH